MIPHCTECHGPLDVHSTDGRCVACIKAQAARLSKAGPA
jgi:hypothetical protein